MSVLQLQPRKLGSFEEYTISLSRSLGERGGESVLAFLSLPPDEHRQAFDDAGAVVETKPFAPFGRASADALRQLLRRHRPDVVHFHFVNLMSLDVLVAALSGARVVYSDHTSDNRRERSALRWAALRTSKRCFSLCVDRFVAPSDYVRRRLLQEGIPGDRVMTIRNGVNLDKFRSVQSAGDVRSKYGLPGDSVLVASVSTLIPQKGVAELIEAAGLAVARGANVSFIHAGEGPLAQVCAARVRELGLEGRFAFTGQVDQPDIAAILQQCDVFLLPCTWGEAFSLAILEAIAAGKPAIVTAVGGNPEAVEDGRNGILVPPHDPSAIADAIVALLDDAERRASMARASAARACEFDVQRWVDQTIELYESLTPALRQRRPESAVPV